MAHVDDLGHMHAAHNGKVFGVDGTLPTQTARNTLALTEPFIAEMRNRSMARSVDDPLATITSSDGHHALVMSYYGNVGYSDPDKEVLPVITTLDRHALVEADVDALLPECGFRMLTPEELKLGMAFAEAYIVTGNKREQVRQIGNAVTPPVAQAIAQRCVESLVS